MNITGSSSSVAPSVSQNDAVAITMLRKTMDIQLSQATQLIESVATSAPQSSSSGIDVYA